MVVIVFATNNIYRSTGSIFRIFDIASKMSSADKITEPEADKRTDKPTESPDEVEEIRLVLEAKLGLGLPKEPESDKILETLDIEGLINKWKVAGFKNIITMVGAGISTSCGIPDFRSPNTGLYNNLKKYDLPHPGAIFEVSFFSRRPQPFFALAKELYPGTFKPSPSHYFVRMLHEKGLLLRHYTQNIDTLERIAGIPEHKLVEAHGTFYTNHCLKCNREYSMQWAKEKIFQDEIPKCLKCNGIVKPDIVFFGENLPEKFYQLPHTDFKQCDLLIIMGTSLEVQPFASLVDLVDEKCVRLLINREAVGRYHPYVAGGLLFDLTGNTRDVAWLGDCDDGVMHLAAQIGFKDDLEELIKKESEQFDADKLVDENKVSKMKTKTKDVQDTSTKQE